VSGVKSALTQIASSTFPYPSPTTFKDHFAKVTSNLSNKGQVSLSLLTLNHSSEKQLETLGLGGRQRRDKESLTGRINKPGVNSSSILYRWGLKFVISSGAMVSKMPA
jgi:hypothetical protein